MLPAWLFTVGMTFYSGTDGIVIPYSNILIGLATLILPCSCGSAFIHFYPDLAPTFRKAIKLLVLVFAIFALPFGLWQGWYVFRLMTWRTLLCGAMLPLSGYSLSYIIAWLLNQNRQDRLTISLQGGIHNGCKSLSRYNFY